MKKSITMLAVAILAITNAVSAANTNSSILSSNVNACVTADASKFVSHADPSLIESELGTLTKSSRTLTEEVNADLAVTETAIQPAVALKKEKACPAIQLKKNFKN